MRDKYNTAIGDVGASGKACLELCGSNLEAAYFDNKVLGEINGLSQNRLFLTLMWSTI
jgi:hypothetical protein